MEEKDKKLLNEVIKAIKDEGWASTIGILEPLAEKGDPTALFLLGTRYLHTMRVPDNDPESKRRVKFIRKDEEKAIQLIKLSAEKGYPRALCWMAKEHCSGRHLEKNETKAFALYKQAADIGYIPAIYQLALCYSFAKGTSLNHDEGVRLCRMAAEAGYPPAEFRISQYYAIGRDVDNNSFRPVAPNPEKQLFWLKRSAENGYIIAQYALGRHLLEVEKDKEQATFWLKEASKMMKGANCVKRQGI